MSSFSSSESTAAIFARRGSGVVLSVRQNKSAVSIDPFTKFKMEDEVVAPKGTRYKVVSTSMQDSGGVLAVELEEA